MQDVILMLVVISTMLFTGGCRTATRVEDVPRVDLDLGSGNRGYLIGQSSAAAEVNTTRQMVHADVELPSFYRVKRGGLPSGTLDELIAPETELPEAARGAVRVGGAPERFDTYVVQKGDSLWSIAARPEVYGKATRWRELLDANADLLKGSPDRLQAGMTLKVPQGGESRGSPEDDAEGATYKK